MSLFDGRLAGLLDAMSRLGATLSGGVESRLQRARDALRAEVRRATAALALALAAAAFAVTALIFAAVAVMLAAWNTHPVLAAALIAMVFAMLALVAGLLMRGNER